MTYKIRILLLTSENSVAADNCCKDRRLREAMTCLVFLSLFFFFPEALGMPDEAVGGQCRDRQRVCMCHTADTRMMKSRRAQHPPAGRWGHGTIGPHTTILAHKQYLSVEHALTLVTRYAAACHISFLQTHTHATMHIVHSHTRTHTLCQFTLPISYQWQ